MTAEGIEEASQLAFCASRAARLARAILLPADGRRRLDDWLAARRRELAAH